MFQPVSLFIGARYSKSRNRTGFVSFITFFSIAGILLGVAALITVVSVMNGLENQLKKSILGVVPHVLVSSSTAQGFNHWQKHQQALQQLPYVSKATPIIDNEALVQSATSLQVVMMQGIEPELEKESFVAKSMVQGQLSILSQPRYYLVMGQSLARKLSVRVGDEVRLILPNQTRFTPMGRVPMQRTFILAGIFNANSPVDDHVVYLHNKNAAKMLRRKGDGISSIRLYLDDAFNVSAFLNASADTLKNYQVTNWQESQGALFAAVAMEKNMMGLSLALIIAVAAFNIVSALVLVVIDKRGEIGILQTFGMNRAGIIKIFISQGMINGLWGVTLGSIAGLLLSYNLNDLLIFFGINVLGPNVSQQLPVVVEVEDVLTIALSALIISFLATLYPAYRASTTQPAEVLRHE